MLKDLVELLSRIAQQKHPIGLEINYDGRTFHWKVKMSNITADELGLLSRSVSKREQV
jgi:hypothetical protein